MRTAHNLDESRAATAAEPDYCARAHRRHCRQRYGERDPTGLPTHASAKTTVDSLDMTGFARSTSSGRIRDQEDENQHQLPTKGNNQPSSHRSRFRLRNLLSLTPGVTLVLILGILSRPCAAAFIAYENCLPDYYVNNEPKLLQWVPEAVDASFNTANGKHTLRITMWGNVAGSATNVTLPPGNDTSYWNDPKKLDGKILSVPEPNAQSPKLTTLRGEIKFLTYEPFSEGKNFCTDKLVNASCPLAPVFNAR